jgi:hypothetical protein
MELRKPSKLQANPSQTTVVSELVNESVISWDDTMEGNPTTTIIMETPSADPVFPSTLALFGLIVVIRGVWKYVNNPFDTY